MLSVTGAHLLLCQKLEACLLLHVKLPPAVFTWQEEKKGIIFLEFGFLIWHSRAAPFLLHRELYFNVAVALTSCRLFSAESKRDPFQYIQRSRFTVARMSRPQRGNRIFFLTNADGGFLHLSAREETCWLDFCLHVRVALCYRKLSCEGCADCWSVVRSCDMTTIIERKKK